MSSHLHRLLLATAVTIMAVVAGAASALAGELPIPPDGGVPRDVLPGDHYHFPVVSRPPAAPTPSPAWTVPWVYLAPSLALFALLLGLLLLHEYHVHHSDHSPRLRGV
ncbi:MAG TPA: hypothetical protein VFL99_17460 [Segeticoccus sp.]|uniref:hypothetical protein n=1 Tax=Segeticoccus sp. TaxID=2706531 RepID=UPI002D7FA2D7|nr:hypothetical protein [Segeticoccus sp.]HET8602115.1 hypothetical protein [Segeticoccus sp.]